MLKCKYDVTLIVPKFFAMVQTQFNKKIKTIRSDNTEELKFTELCNKQGTLHQFFCIDRHEQNSIINRKHQHILNVARTLHLQAHTPIKFWNVCVLTPTYLINRTPISILHNVSLYEKICNTFSNYSEFRIFGCLAYVSTLPKGRMKFQPRARSYVFLGYSPEMKGYKMYNIKIKYIFISRDIIFYEDVFPFQLSSLNKQPIPLFTHVIPVPNHENDETTPELSSMGMAIPNLAVLSLAAFTQPTTIGMPITKKRILRTRKWRADRSLRLSPSLRHIYGYLVDSSKHPHTYGIFTVIQSPERSKIIILT